MFLERTDPASRKAKPVCMTTEKNKAPSHVTLSTVQRAMHGGRQIYFFLVGYGYRNNSHSFRGGRGDVL